MVTRKRDSRGIVEERGREREMENKRRREAAVVDERERERDEDKTDVVYDIPNLFSPSLDGYLSCANGAKIKAESLKGKTIVIHFWPVNGARKNENFTLAQSMLEVYEEHYSKGDFEFVSVPILGGKNYDIVDGDEEEKFRKHHLSRMPWPMVPLSDLETRRQLTEEFNFGYYQFEWCAFVGSNAKLFHIDAGDRFYEFGVDYYPFTDQRLTEIWPLISIRPRFQDISSLHSFLGTPGRDFLLSNQGNKVPINDLEGKVVGLYLHGSMRSVSLLPKLMLIYNELKVTRGLEFEIVLVNLHFNSCGYRDEESFNQGFGNMPWLALPFRDKTCRRLWQIYNTDAEDGCEDMDDGVFVIISSNGKTVDPYGAKVLVEYGVDGYPFTRERAVEIVNNKVNSMRVIPRIIGSGAPLIRWDGTKVDAQHIVGKNIVLFVGAVSVNSTRNFLTKLLLTWYREIKAKDPNFEVIYLSRDKDEFIFNYLLKKMPWLSLPYTSHFRPIAILDDLEEAMFFYHYCYLFALGEDGRVVSIDATRQLKERGADAYPFKDEGELLDDVKYQLAERFVWRDKDKHGCSFRIPCWCSEPFPRYSNPHERLFESLVPA